MTDTKKPGFRKWIMLIILLFSPGFVLYMCSRHITSQGKQKLVEMPNMAKLNDFSLRKENGEIITLESLKGNITIITTIQNTCPDSCGIQLGQFNELVYKHIYNHREKQDYVRILSVAIDSEGKPVDNFDKINYSLNKYIQNYDENLWSVATGDPKQVFDVEINGKVLFDEISETSYGGKLYMNSVLLVDKKGQVRSVRLGKGEAQVRDFTGELRGLIGEYKYGDK